MQVYKINYIIQDKSRYFTADQRVSRYPWHRWLGSSHPIRRFIVRGLVQNLPGKMPQLLRSGDAYPPDTVII
jgi:hypothetical protein